MSTPRRSYFVIYPRDFANEYTVYATESPVDFRAAFPNADPVTRREAVRLGWTRPKEARRDGEQWFGGFLGRDGDTLAETIEDCVRETDGRVAAQLAGHAFA